MPSAVFTSVTGTFTFSVTADEPSAYEPPAIATLAVVCVSETSWNVGFDDGKFPPVVTDSLVPFTEMTADDGGAVGGAGGTFGGGVVFVFGGALDFVVPLPGALGPLELNGSLLSKSENDWSCPAPAEACTASISCDEPFGAAPEVAVTGPDPLSVGAAGGAPELGTVAGVGVAGVVVAEAATGFPPPPPAPEFSDIIVCTA